MRWIRDLFGQAEPVDWEALYSDLLPRVFNYFRYHGLEDATAEDLASITCEKAWRARERYCSDQSAAATWVFTIARRTLVDFYRTGCREAPLEMLDGKIPPGKAVEGPEERAARGGDIERLRCLLRRLPQRERELLALKYGAEMTNRAIARATGLSESNVGTILHRVVARLRAQMEENDG